MDIGQLTIYGYVITLVMWDIICCNQYSSVGKNGPQLTIGYNYGYN